MNQPFPQTLRHANSLGIGLVRIEPGQFVMGSDDVPLDGSTGARKFNARGDWDEWPRHTVTISRPFYLGSTEVTNAQYEQFDPTHRRLRGHRGWSCADDEAVVYVSHDDATGFCRWLSEREGLPYCLPTEAQWEYACRAGTSTPFWTGPTWPGQYGNNQGVSWWPQQGRAGEFHRVVPCRVGQTPANPWGLHDMHGNVEEWCHDWYGPYADAPATDPAGPASGDFRVTRGGSHSTETFYLRSANRAAALPGERNWLIGLRVAIAEPPTSQPSPPAPPRRWAIEVRQSRSSQPAQPAQQAKPSRTLQPTPGRSTSPSADAAMDRPLFRMPVRYVKIDPQSAGPLFANHNHCPAITDCPNGDLLAIWYSTTQEHTRELTIAGSRLRAGSTEWEPADWFWGAPDRNNHASALYHDRATGRLFHFNGLSPAATWGNLELVMRTSDDSGATWSAARIICAHHGEGNMPSGSVIRTRDGHLLLPCDYGSGTTLQVSPDGGATWAQPGGMIRGIHAGLEQLADGRLMALGRYQEIDGMMAMSLSEDLGRTWTYRASPFGPIGGGQRAVLRRLNEGPLFVASFADAIRITDASGHQRLVAGLYAALSFDEGVTWPCIRPISNDGAGTLLGANDARRFVMSFSHGEPGGYLAMCQTSDSLVHLISSGNHYVLNLAWLKTPAPAASVG